MKLDPRHLEILAAIVEHGGLTEGAEALGKSQPSVSRTLAQLEARVGIALFKPGRRPLQPTELGLALAEQGRVILKSNRTAAEIVAFYRTGQSGAVRVGGTPIIMDGVIASMIATFQQHVPDVRVDQSYGYADELFDRLRNGTMDLSIMPLQLERAPKDISFQPVLHGLNVVACREGHPLTRRKLLTPKDIAEFPWIAPPAKSPLYRDLQRALTNIGAADFRISFTGGSLASVWGVLTGSDSLTVLPYSVVFLASKSTAVTALSLEIGHPERVLGFAMAKDVEVSPATKRFNGFLQAQLEALSVRIERHQKDRLWR